jgi:HKD family nuclease
MSAADGTNICLLTEAQAKAAIRRLIKRSETIDIAVAWAGMNDVVDALVAAAPKLRHVTIGTHLYQTDPDVLRRFLGQSAAHYTPPNARRLFHPKVYLFDLGGSAAALVGSHNLTSAAFDAKNVEASLLVEGAVDDRTFKALAVFVKRVWLAAKPIEDNDFLFSYELQYQANKAKRAALGRFAPLKRPRHGRAADGPLAISWSKFVCKVQVDRSLDERLNVLEGAASIFSRGIAFARMECDERRAIAGTLGRKEERQAGLPWGWFGTMFAQGDFKNLVRQHPSDLSKALARIPFDGDVSERDYGAFVREFRSAFQGLSRVGDVATASRLLAMKRPDRFACVNRSNRKGICDAFGVAHTTLNLDNYWDRIVVPLQFCPWWHAPRPRDAIQSRIWDNRAALIDCIYYVGGG